MTIPLVAVAEPPTLSGGVTSRYSDNVTRVPDGAQDDVETRTTLSFAHQTDPGACNARTRAEFGYGVWSDDTFEPELYSELDFLGDCSVTDNIRWELSDYLRDVVQDGRNVDTPDNRTRKNIFRTGPVLTVRLSQVDRLEISAQYENTEFEENSEIDSERLLGSAWVTRSFSPSTDLGVRFLADRAELETGEEIDRDTASLTFRKAWSATQIQGALGFTEYESRFMDQVLESDAIVGNFTLERDVSASTVAFLSATHELTDQTSDIDVRIGDITINLREQVGVEVTTIRAGMRTVYSDRSNMELALFSNRTEYLQSAEEEDGRGADFRYRLPVVSRLDGLLGARVERRSFQPEDRDDTLVNVHVGLSYQATRKLDLVGRVGRSSRDSNVPTTEYEDNWFELGLNYRFL
ncbi:outer membrane beta-barrel protein [Marinobacter sp. SS21]|uniref:outer membrane beta-barrel protein n=1 Tax=Marinobacter sp. SS21 TaxID=2979460 RepID=UPI00232C0C93|nr:outer membrane beta-barrel protein [Marinobacter sp. SS21]MDC0661954.1 outer membrane beta-barrel protein [Marinobacter sp. SS21]